jgi:uncharacterized protein YutE (UPF0331/DUF86 family)
MAPVDADKLRHHIQFVRSTLPQLREIRDEGEASFLASPRSQAAAVRFLHTAVEALVDIANHVIAREGLGIPRAYADAVSLLVKADVLPRDREETFLQMVRFRNRAVHLYDEIDPAEVFAILRDDLDDFEAFLAPIVARYLAS